MPRRVPAVTSLLWLGLGPWLGGWSAGPADLCVISRHSGELLQGKDFPLDGPRTPSRARALAESARIEEAAGRAAPVVPGVELSVDPDRIAVRRRAGGENRPVPEQAPARAIAPVEVQVFGLVGPDRVSVRCRDRAVRVDRGSVEELPPGWQPLSVALRTGAILCTGGPWEVRVARSRARPYAGVLSFRPLPERAPEPGSTPREARARRGSEIILRTTLSSYVAGVMAAEDAALDGEAGLALAQVIAHDARVERHPGRPVCDTTHCQVFLGTAVVTPVVARALALPELPTTRWLPYFRGGDEPWEVRRPAAEVRAAVGDAERLDGNGRVLEIVRPGGVERVPCEPIRAMLRLQGCPSEGVFEGETVRLRGRGRGHGLGLDVEAARTSGLTAPDLLRRAYGLP